MLTDKMKIENYIQFCGLKGISTIELERWALDIGMTGASATRYTRDNENIVTVIEHNEKTGKHYARYFWKKAYDNLMAKKKEKEGLLL